MATKAQGNKICLPKPSLPPKPSPELLKQSPGRRSLRASIVSKNAPISPELAQRALPPPPKPVLPVRTVPPKPQLLPKPHLPKDPDLVLSSKKQAPVARLDEFSDNPVRPPRAPKCQRQPGSPPPVRPKPFLTPPCAATKQKSASLGRDVDPSAWFVWQGTPIRPPRRKGGCPARASQPLGRSVSLFSSIEQADKNNIPIYATVNYSLKKNRRVQQQTKSADCLDSKPRRYNLFTNSEELLDKSELSEQPEEEEERRISTEKKNIYEELESNLESFSRELEALEKSISEKSDEQVLVSQSEPANLISGQDKDCMGNSECASLLDLCAKNVDRIDLESGKTEVKAESNEDENSSKLEEFFSANTSHHSSLNDIMPDILDEEGKQRPVREDDESFGSAENVVPSDSNYVTMSDHKGSPHLKHKSLSKSLLTRKKRHKLKKEPDGELSAGVLGDLDSDTARSVDDVQGDERERKNSFFNNFIRGKQNRKSKDKKESSTFYLRKGKETPSIVINSDFETEPEEEEEEENLSVNSTYSKLSIEPTLSTNSINSTNSVCSEPDTNSDLSEEQKKALKAFKTAEELMTSERTYVDSLKLLCVDFRSYVKVQSGKDSKNPIIHESDLNKILNHLPQLLVLNEDLLRDLENRIVCWNENEKISDIIVKKGPFLKLYTSYMQDFEVQVHFLDECCHKSAAFARVVHEFEALPRCNKLRLSHYMLTPVQRFTKYRLLLQQYLHYLDQHSPDYQDTQVALQIVCEVAEHANKSMREGDALSKMLKLQSLLGCELIKPGRVLIRQGELQKICRKGIQPRYFILFSDCLMYTSYHGSALLNGLKMNLEIPLQTVQVRVSSTEDYSNEFSIISVKRSFTLVASSAKERDAWVEDMKAAVKDKVSKQQSFQQAKLIADGLNRPMTTLGHTAPLWIPDDRVTTCQNCAVREFSLTHRRHHCRACGYVVCGDCSTNKALLRYIQYQAARVCDKCYDILQKEFDDPLFSLPADLSNEAINEIMENAKIYYRKNLPSGKKTKAPVVPQRLLEVTAMESECTIKGWLQRLVNRSWKKMWFVLKDQVLYAYKASEDVVAIETTPVLGFSVETPDHMVEGVHPELVFTLSHKTASHLPLQAQSSVPKMVFHAEFKDCAERWIEAFKSATVLN
ncbi:FYVE, RhoGEF and PH domain-containing protein 6-like [Neocloeon triangulifer]|uniref:FYVE, RhoGEF and PH domain-containing protein 6-like n=1 Tax=Neocloeon triangulifer TaxID=2078957 RepID=UPI00286F5D9E|nr:FYVE, RhoGEF and PH domain-containing protein 6-like [Neocloeon triangulifer]XP_059489497.1 FYVE, RhoGEF and PH domain-containing protein 6-like [Neocloeon triangulifer]